MTPPELDLTRDETKCLLTRDDPPPDLVDRVVRALCDPPNHVVVRGLPPLESREPAIGLARAIARREPTKPGLSQAERERVSFTTVRIDPDKADGRGVSTAYSRTNLPLDLHTDSSYRPVPHALVGFHMIRADPAGGDTLLAGVGDILERLDDDCREMLARPIYPFGRGLLPVLWDNGRGPRIRYYRSQIDGMIARGEPLPEAAMAALDNLDSVLRRADVATRFRLEPGHILFIHNTRVLHGRTGFAAASDRLMYRVRVDAGCLG